MPEITALGIDPASSTGYCLMRGDLEIAGGAITVAGPGWTKTPETAAEASIVLGNLLRKMNYEHSPIDIIVCENPTSRSRGIGKAYGILMAGLVVPAKLLDIPLTFVLPTVWKKQVVGAGNATKHAYATYAMSVIGRAPDNEDHAAAICLARYGQTVDAPIKEK